MLRFSPAGASVLIAGGLTACLISIGALRLMTLYWRNRMGHAASRTMVHMVPSRIDVVGKVFWCVVYALGGLVVIWGIWALSG